MPSSPRILMADDETGFRETTVRLLRDEGYECDSVPDAETAYRMLGQYEYNLVIADIVMPGNPNLEFIEKIGSEFRGLPVIIVTGYPSVDTVLKSMSLKVFAYLPKPFEFDEFAAKVKEAVKWNLVHLAVSNAEKRLVDQIGKASQINEMMTASSDMTPGTSLNAFLTLLHYNINSAILDLGNLLKAQYGSEEKSDGVCHILDCPQKNTYIHALEKAVEVLRATKGAFKSKEIASLRRELEDVLEGERRKASRFGLRS